MYEFTIKNIKYKGANGIKYLKLITKRFLKKYED
jgi:hypothetical protein